MFSYKSTFRTNSRNRIGLARRTPRDSRLARVIAVHPASRTVDLAFLDNGERVGKVPIASEHVGSDGGSWNVPDVPKPTQESSPDALVNVGRNLVVKVDYIGREPIVQGFVTPATGQMTFGEQNRYVFRHASGACVTIAPDGSVQVGHPAGAFVRIGTGAALEDLGGVSAGGNWSIPSGAPPATITVATAGTTLTINPNGPVEVVTAGEVHWTCSKTVHNGDFQLNGKLDATGEVTGKAGTSASVTLTGHHGHNGGSQPPTPGT